MGAARAPSWGRRAGAQAGWITAYAVLLGAWLSVPTPVHAQPALRALDAVWLTPRLDADHDALSVAASAGYGAMGGVAGSGGTHQRVQGSLAVALRSRLGFGLELRSDGRWDLHPGSDDSMVGDPRLLGRYARKLSEALRAGLELGVWLPGRGAPSLAWSAISADVLALAEYTPTPRWAFSAALGPRFDRSAESVSRVVVLSRADTLSLAVSSHHALLARLAATTTLHGTQLAAELSADLLLGDGAPRALDSPIRAALVARRWLGRARRCELSATLSLLLSGRAPLVPQRYTPYEPRAGGFVGFRYLLERRAEKPAPAPPPPAPVVMPVPAVEPPSPRATLLLQVVDEAGEPLPDVRVAVQDGPEQRTGGAGRVLLEGIADGDREVEISAGGFESQRVQFSARAELPSELTVTLRGAREESVLRVQVRDAQTGAALVANCELFPARGGKRALQRLTTSAEGSAELALPAGKYRVAVQAAGYATQTRALEVYPQGVTLFNIDLTPETP